MSLDPSPLLSQQFSTQPAPDIDIEQAMEVIAEDPSTSQLLIRSSQDGVESIMVYQKIQFEPGQLTGVLNVPFVPPLAGLPEIDGSLTDGTDARVRVTDCQVYGVRIEVVLSKSEDRSVSRMLLLSIVLTDEN